MPILVPIPPWQSVIPRAESVIPGHIWGSVIPRGARSARAAAAHPLPPAAAQDTRTRLRLPTQKQD
eukprot:1189372-Rhodomonas_salina.1